MKNASYSLPLCLLLALSLAACDFASVSETEGAKPLAERLAESLPTLNEVPARHTPSGPIIDIHVPLQTVEAQRNDERFPARVQARIRVFPGGAAQGQFRWNTRTDGLLILQATGGQGHFDDAGALERVELEFVTPDGALVQATVTPDAGLPGCDVWDFMGTGVSPVNNVTFEATGQIVVRRALLLHYPRQTVEAERDGEHFRARFAAQIRVFPDGTAQGELRLHSRVGGLTLVLEAVSGQGHFSSDGTLERVEIGGLRSDGELVQATVTPDADGVPRCDIWDFMSNGPVNNVRFDATGRIVVR